MADSDQTDIPFGHQFHKLGTQIVLEIWPLDGEWNSFCAAVPVAESARMVALKYGVRGQIDGTVDAEIFDFKTGENTFVGKGMDVPITKNEVAHIVLTKMPSELRFGPRDTLFVIAEDAAPSGTA